MWKMRTEHMYYKNYNYMNMGAEKINETNSTQNEIKVVPIKI